MTTPRNGPHQPAEVGAPAPGARLVALIVFWLALFGLSFWLGAVLSGRSPQARPLSVHAAPAPNSATSKVGPSPSSGVRSPLDRALAETDSAHRAALIAELLAPMDEVQLRALLATLSKLPRSARLSELEFSIYRKLGTIAPESTLERLVNLPDGLRQQYEDLVLSGWVTVSPRAAWDWIYSRVDGTSGRTAEQKRYLGLLETLVKNDRLDVAAEIVAGLPANLSRRLSATEIARYLAEYKPEQAEAWLAHFQGIDRTNVVIGVVSKLAETDPERALDFATRSGENSVVLMYVFRGWAASGDKGAAMAWLDSHPPSAEVDRALEGFITTMAGTDLAGAASLLERASSPDVRKRLQQRVASESTGPGPAFDWILATTPAAERMQAAEAQAVAWQRRDRTGLATYLRTTTRFTQEERETLLRKAGLSDPSP